MIRKSSLLALAVAAVAGTAMTASAAPIVTLSLQVFTADGSTQLLAGVDGKYHVDPGTQVQVVINGAVTSPNLLASTRATAVKNKPLGIQTLNTDLVSVIPGSPAGVLGGANSNGAVPTNDAASGQPNQQPGFSYTDYTPDGVGYPFVNLNDLGGDGDLDVNGTGFTQTTLTAPTSSTTYPKDSYGTTAGGLNLVGHLYTINSDVELNTHTTALNVFRDPGSGSLAADNDINNVAEGSAIFAVNAIPEPASISLLGLGALGLIARRRRA